jgi:hypothetical protein
MFAPSVAYIYMKRGKYVNQSKSNFAASVVSNACQVHSGTRDLLLYSV